MRLNLCHIRKPRGLLSSYGVKEKKEKKEEKTFKNKARQSTHSDTLLDSDVPLENCKDKMLIIVHVNIYSN